MAGVPTLIAAGDEERVLGEGTGGAEGTGVEGGVDEVVAAVFASVGTAGVAGGVAGVPTLATAGD